MSRAPLLPIAIAALAALPVAALAASNTPAGTPGFFKPTPDGDPALQRNVTPADNAPAAPPVIVTSAPTVTQAVTHATTRGAVVSVEDRAEATHRAETDMDRAEREHEAAREQSARAATTLQGAFTGLTSERDR